MNILMAAVNQRYNEGMQNTISACDRVEDKAQSSKINLGNLTGITACHSHRHATAVLIPAVLYHVAAQTAVADFNTLAGYQLKNFGQLKWPGCSRLTFKPLLKLGLKWRKQQLSWR